MAAQRAGFRVEGATQLQASLGRLAADVQDFEATHVRAGSLVVTEASRRAPRRTGRLAASGHAQATGTRATVTWAAPYASVINYGTGPRPGRRGPHNIRASRFADQAVEAAEPVVVPWYLDALDRMVAKVKGA